MNIFFLHHDARQAAEWQVDKHVVKMIVETAQMLSTAHRLIDGTFGQQRYMRNIWHTDEEGNKTLVGQKPAWRKHWFLPDHREGLLYRVTHANHPSTVWCRQSVSNYNWLVDHFFALGDEYTYRYEKLHNTIRQLGQDLQCPPVGLKEWDWTDPPACMPDEYKTSKSVIENYQNYYREAKAHIHKWKKRDKPDWI